MNAAADLLQAPPGRHALLTRHLEQHSAAVASLSVHVAEIAAWGDELARRLRHGHRLLAAGNGGSAAAAQHLTAELVGRFDGERAAFSAIALHADTSSLTAIGNDYGFDAVFARQVHAHARRGDVVMLLSTSGRSGNLVAAAQAAHAVGAQPWALTGPPPNPLADVCRRAVAITGSAAAVQEAQLVVVHLLCRVFDARVGRGAPVSGRDREETAR